MDGSSVLEGNARYGGRWEWPRLAPGDAGPVHVRRPPAARLVFLTAVVPAAPCCRSEAPHSCPARGPCSSVWAPLQFQSGLFSLLVEQNHGPQNTCLTGIWLRRIPTPEAVGTLLDFRPVRTSKAHGEAEPQRTAGLREDAPLSASAVIPQGGSLCAQLVRLWKSTPYTWT